MGITHNFCLVATAIDIVDTSCRDDVDARVFLRIVTTCEGNTLLDGITLLVRSTLLNFVGIIIILFIAIDRIWRQITASIQFLNNHRFATAFLDVYRDRTIDGSTGVVTAEYTVQRRAVGHSKMNIVVDICILRATEHFPDTFGTVQLHYHFSVNVCILTAAVCLIHIHRTVREHA